MMKTWEIFKPMSQLIIMKISSLRLWKIIRETYTHENHIIFEENEKNHRVRGRNKTEIFTLKKLYVFREKFEASHFSLCLVHDENGWKSSARFFFCRLLLSIVNMC